MVHDLRHRRVAFLTFVAGGVDGRHAVVIGRAPYDGCVEVAGFEGTESVLRDPFELRLQPRRPVQVIPGQIRRRMHRPGDLRLPTLPVVDFDPAHGRRRDVVRHAVGKRLAPGHDPTGDVYRGHEEGFLAPGARHREGIGKVGLGGVAQDDLVPVDSLGLVLPHDPVDVEANDFIVVLAGAGGIRPGEGYAALLVLGLKRLRRRGRRGLEQNGFRQLLAGRLSPIVDELDAVRDLVPDRRRVVDVQQAQRPGNVRIQKRREEPGRPVAAHRVVHPGGRVLVVSLLEPVVSGPQRDGKLAGPLDAANGPVGEPLLIVPVLVRPIQMEPMTGGKALRVVDVGAIARHGHPQHRLRLGRGPSGPASQEKRENAPDDRRAGPKTRTDTRKKETCSHCSETFVLESNRSPHRGVREETK